MREQSSKTTSFGNIQEAFEYTKCFLLKHPGKKVSSSGAASQIKIAGTKLMSKIRARSNYS